MSTVDEQGDFPENGVVFIARPCCVLMLKHEKFITVEVCSASITGAILNGHREVYLGTYYKLANATETLSY